MNGLVIPINVMEITRKLVESVNMTAHDLRAPARLPDADMAVSPAERQALRDLCALADLLNLPEGAWLLMPATDSMPDVLAAFETDREDIEDGNDREAEDEHGGDVNDEPRDGDEVEPDYSDRG